MRNAKYKKVGVAGLQHKAYLPKPEVLEIKHI